MNTFTELSSWILGLNTNNDIKKNKNPPRAKSNLRGPTQDINKNHEGSNLKSNYGENIDFQVVIVRYNEDLHWASDELQKENVIIYNKGPKDLKYLSKNFNVINVPNTGYLGGTYLYHIIKNYDKLASRTLFLQANPLEAPIPQFMFQPFSAYKTIESLHCKNIIAKCSYANTLDRESKLLSNLDWSKTKYKDFTFAENINLYEFINKYIDHYNANKTLNIVYGAQFAVDREKILCRDIEYYQRLYSTIKDKKLPMEDHFLERSWDLVFDDSKCTKFITKKINNFSIENPRQYLEIEGIDPSLTRDLFIKQFYNQMYNLEKQSDNTTKIPLNAHSIYLSNYNSHFNPMYIKLLLNMMKKLKKYNVFEYYIWTNDAESIPKKLIESGVKIRSITEFKKHLLYNIIEKKIADYKQTDSQEALITLNDILKSLILHQNGGFYRDLDYYIHDTETLHKMLVKFDAVVGETFHQLNNDITWNNSSHIPLIGNNFLASISNHPFTSAMITLLERNFYPEISVSVPDYIKLPANKLSKISFLSGQMMATIATYKTLDSQCYNNIVAPWFVFNENNSNDSPNHFPECNTAKVKANNFKNYTYLNKRFNQIGVDLDCKPWNQNNVMTNEIKYKTVKSYSMQEPQGILMMEGILPIEVKGITQKSVREKLMQHFFDEMHNIDLYNSDLIKIPLKAHVTYFNYDEPFKRSKNVIDKSDIEIALHSARTLDKVANFEHFIWTTNKDIAPRELVENGFTVRLISEFEDHKLYPILTYLIEQAALPNSGRGGLTMASDITRSLVVEKEGGFYRDMDYEIYNSKLLLKILKKFDAFVGEETPWWKVSNIGSAFFGAVPHHPFPQQNLYLFERNFNLYDDAPDYVKYIANGATKNMFLSGPTALTVSAYKTFEIEGYNNLFAPWFVFFNTYYVRMQHPEINCYPIGKPDYPPTLEHVYDDAKFETVGGDMLCGKWLETVGYMAEIHHYLDI